MEDEPDVDEELTPEAEARVRAALAAAGTDAPMPQDVVARLDAVLAGLVDERQPRTAPVRRRGAGRYLLVAASVVAVVAVGIPVVRGITDAGTSGTASSTAADGAASPGLNQPAPDPSLKAAQPEDGSAAPAELGTATFRADVRRLLPGLATLRVTGQDAAAGSCGGATTAAGVSLTRQVLLDRSPALLEVYPAVNGRQLVRAVSCDGARTLASARVPAP